LRVNLAFRFLHMQTRTVRIASLLPSATEILYALGLGDSVVGVTHECDFPPAAASKPRLIRPRVDPAALPAELDRQVRALVSRGESIYSVDDVLLRSLAPDLIITQDLCHVCAASPDDLAAALSRMPFAPQVLSLQPQTLAGVWDDIRKIGEAARRLPEADRLASDLARRVAQTEAAVKTAVTPSISRPRVVCLEWLDPFYVGGHWVPEMVTLAGGIDLFGRAGAPSFRVTHEQVVQARPEVIVVMQCGYGVARNRDDYRRTKFPTGWTDLPAVRSGRVFAVDANSYFSRSGPRLANGLAILAHLFHPTSFHQECALPGIPAHAFCPIEIS
ncbi:MAG TPA: cobalamin-binding protein, partial [Candidatus Acidoferrales bacterium]|nr:cobalamin-binding protein [Candidatus Acidoferrales bacterium]